MGYSVQKADFGAGMPFRYFVYSDTCELSLPPLYPTPEAARASKYPTRDAEDDSAVGQPIGAISDAAGEDTDNTQAFVIRLRKAFGLPDGSAEDGEGKDWFSLATTRQLLLPGDGTFTHNAYALMRRDGALHAAMMVSGAFTGDFLLPACDQNSEYRADDEWLSIDAFFQQPLDLCPHCLRALLEGRRWRGRGRL